jgi:hypothetical protein
MADLGAIQTSLAADGGLLKRDSERLAGRPNVAERVLRLHVSIGSRHYRQSTNIRQNRYDRTPELQQIGGKLCAIGKVYQFSKFRR